MFIYIVGFVYIYIYFDQIFIEGDSFMLVSNYWEKFLAYKKL